MEIPSRWNEVLEALHRGGFPEAMIGGGALRDLDHDKPIKDVDIFVAVRNSSDATKIKLDKVFGYVGTSIFDDDNALTEDSDDYPWDLSIFGGAWDWTHYDPAPKGRISLAAGFMPNFQVIALDLPADSSFMDKVLDDFDIGLCRIAYVPGLIVTGPGYDEDSRDKTLTILKAPGEAALERSRKRVRRLLEKYSDFAPRVPEDVERQAIEADLKEEVPF